jgi:cytochrome b
MKRAVVVVGMNTSGMASCGSVCGSDPTQQLSYPRNLLKAERSLQAHPNPAVALMVSTTVRMVQQQVSSSRNSAV